MKAFTIAAVAALFFGPLMALASGPTVLYSFEVQSQTNGYVKA